jgi:TonB family protein
MLTRLAIAVAITFALIPGPAVARDWGYVSGWYVTSADQSCGMFTPPTRPQSADILILKRLDGALYVQTKNAAWNMVPGNEAQVQYQIDGRTYGGAQKTIAYGPAAGKGLMSAFGSDFERDMRGGSLLSIFSNGRLIEQIPLSGTAAAFATVQSCLDDLRANGNINSSMAASGFASLAVTSVSPKGDISRWISLEDYPRAALREQREGTVGFRLDVGNDGKVLGCTITKSSGHQDLDVATCAGMTKRARFDPAKDSSGAKTAGSYQSRVSWKLPS